MLCKYKSIYNSLNKDMSINKDKSINNDKSINKDKSINRYNIKPYIEFHSK